jgi:molybdopterin converting factor subunit 1
VTQIVKLRLFARFRDAFGVEVLDLALPPQATVKDVREQVAALDPGITALLAKSNFAVNGEIADDDTPVRADDELALLPPVSGG